MRHRPRSTPAAVVIAAVAVFVPTVSSFQSSSISCSRIPLFLHSKKQSNYNDCGHQDAILPSNWRRAERPSFMVLSSTTDNAADTTNPNTTGARNNNNNNNGNPNPQPQGGRPRQRQRQQQPSSNHDKKKRSNNNNKSKQQKKVPTPYERWLDDTYDWMRAQSVEDRLPSEITDYAPDLLRGWVKIYPTGSTRSNAPLRRDCAAKSDWLLHRFVTERESLRNEAAKNLPTVDMYTMGMEAWTSCAHGKDDLVAARSAKALLDLMQEQHDRYPTEAPQPSIACYNAVITAYANSRSEEGLIEANEVLIDLERRFEASLDICRSLEEPQPAVVNNKDDDPCMDFRIPKPTTNLYNILFNALVKLSVSKTAGTMSQHQLDMARAMLQRMERQYVEVGNVHAKPTSYSYTSVMSIFTTRRRAQEGQDILEQMERMWQRDVKNADNDVSNTKTKVNVLRPDVISYNTVMSCWANSARPESGERAQAILDNMHVKPNRRSYNAIILAHAKSGNPVMAQETLDKMQNVWEQQQKKLEDGTETNNNEYDDLKPDVRTFTTVMNAWGRSSLPGAASRARGILTSMNEMYDATGDESIKPNKISYTAVLDALAFSKTEADSSIQALELLNEMKAKSSVDVNNCDLLPDVRSYNAVLNAFSRSAGAVPEAADRAEEILTEMEDSPILQPDAFSYNAVILTHVREHTMESAQKAHKVLMRMEQRYGERHTHNNNNTNNSMPRPTINNYSSVMNALASNSDRDGPDIARQVADMLTKLLEDKNNKYNGPDLFCFKAVIFAWSRSVDPKKGIEAYAALKLMRENGVQPDLPSYITVMNACAYTTFQTTDHETTVQENKDLVFGVAKRVFKELQADSTLQINEAVYSVFMRCCKVLLSTGETATAKIEKQKNNADTSSTANDATSAAATTSPRELVILALFKKACQDGFVSHRFVRECIMRGEEKLFHKIFLKYGGKDARAIWQNVPQEWKANVGKVEFRR